MTDRGTGCTNQHHVSLLACRRPASQNRNMRCGLKSSHRQDQRQKRAIILLLLHVGKRDMFCVAVIVIMDAFYSNKYVCLWLLKAFDVALISFLYVVFQLMSL